MIDWIDVDIALVFHNMQIAEHGGTSGVRDTGLLESALARPRDLKAYEPEADIARLAVSYAFGIIKNHPFLDGNKRTGYVVMETFLVLNGLELAASEEEKYPIVIGVADGTITEEELAAWLRERLVAA
jgi:death on curing protein